MVFIRFILFWRDIVNDFLDKNCPYIAGAISFYTLFSMFPLFLAVTSILGFALGPRAEDEQLELALKIADVVPVSSDFIRETMEGVINARAITGIASVLVLLAAATAVFGAIRKGVNAAWGIKTPRPFLKERLIDFALVIGAGVVMLAVLFTGPTLGVLREVTSIIAPDSARFTGLIWNLIALLFAPIIAFGTFLTLYTYLPNTHVRISDIWLGALLASLAFDAANLAFVWYVSAYTHYNVLYGSVGAILALLTWVYLSAIILLLGALITSRYAAYVASIPGELHSLRFLWAGFSRVRLRVVEPSRAA